jgi:hypothetical protein
MQVLAAWLKPAGNDVVRSQLASLIATMKRRNVDSFGEAKAIIETYVCDLADVSKYGLQEACTAFRRNEVGDGWFPTPGELRQEATYRAMRANAEFSSISAILAARVPPKPEPPEVRKAAIARYEEIIRPALEHATEPSRRPIPEPGTVVLPPASDRLKEVLAKQFRGAA